MDNFNFGQFRRSQFNSYLKPLTYTFETKLIDSVTSSSIKFKNQYVVLTGDNQLINLEGNEQKSYYLRIRVHKMDSSQKIKVKLINSNLTEDNTQDYGYIEIPSGNKNDYSSFEFIFTPNQTYNQIGFILDREIEDYTQKNEDGTYGRLTNIEIERLDNIQNIIKTISPSTENAKKLIQIGVQSEPGMLMCINGEGIKVGKSGLYEINNGIKITFIGFIIENESDSRKFFLDYRY